ncbi:nucleotide exchange factor GrpE [Candidatus Magnetobacterium casense]|uniref:Nucleotide exchange factor GrpE n=1 Tax=Candidatus Magnetobacterium casense TaxID=1455061 RepID=A0ABS6RWC9_9BACT|nr:nucleotide exchange factor GrpE [Candidatus Magnetobacterium casensis]MBV6340940.1 nucleotide exchange factor GrpE [Candidatus Magnetobacterium casensis]
MFERAKERFYRFERYIRKIGDRINKALEKHYPPPVALIDYMPQEQISSDKIPADDILLDEIKDIKKAIRRQSISLEVIKNDIIERLDQKSIKDLHPLMELADNFFFLGESFTEDEYISPGQEEAIEIVWQKLDNVLSMFNLEVIRDIEVPFDPALHEAIESTCQQTDNPTVERVLQPGYRYRGDVVKPARVIIGDFY